VSTVHSRARPAGHHGSGRGAPGRLRTAAGLLLLLGGAGTLLGIITAEALYPVPFDPGVDTVSDLAAMRPENIVRQPSAAIFNGTMITMGVCIGVAGLLLHHLERRWSITVPVVALGAGMTAVGLVPGYHLAAHTILAMIAFLSGGSAALLTARLQVGPLRLVHRVLGAVALGALAAYTLFKDSAAAQALGEGGAERWIVYAVVLWLVVLGTTLARSPDTPGDAPT
jgi:hypothetical membrane protein